MNKVITLVFASMLLIANSSQASPNHRNHSHHHGAPNWIAPIVIGGVLGYALAQPRQPNPQIVVVPNTYPQVPPGYRWDQLWDTNCNCYRWVLVPY